jgi:hypothetical protein
LNCLVNRIERLSLSPPSPFLRRGGGSPRFIFPVYYTAGTNLELVPGIFGSHPLYFPRCVAVWGGGGGGGAPGLQYSRAPETFGYLNLKK